MTQLRAENVIIGSGVTGLYLASKMPNALIISKENGNGGLIATTHIDGFNFDYGGHVYTTAHETTRALMIAANGVLHPERKAFYDVKKLVPFPAQDHSERLGLDITPGKGYRRQPGLLGHMLREFGVDFTEGFLDPFNRRVWTTDASEMDNDWVVGRMKAKSETPKQWGMNANFYYAKGSEITDVLLQGAYNNGVGFLAGEVVKIDYSERIIHFFDSAGTLCELIVDDIIVDTTGLFNRDLRSNNVLSIGIGLTHQLRAHDFHWIYPNLSSIVHRVTLLSRYADGMAPNGCDSLLLEIPYIGAEGIHAAMASLLGIFSEDAASRNASAAALLKNAGFKDKFGISTVWAAATRGYPVQTIGVRKAVSKRKHSLAQEGVYMLGRWGSHGYFNLQHIFDEVDHFINFLDTNKGGENYFDSAFYYPRQK